MTPCGNKASAIHSFGFLLFWGSGIFNQVNKGSDTLYFNEQNGLSRSRCTDKEI